MFKVQGVNGKKLSIKVPRPRLKPKAVRLFPKSSSLVTTKKNYSKAAGEDPSQFFNIGFGQTGLTGES